MNFCTVCQKEASKHCGRCRSVYYCSTACQKSDWKNHKLNCRMDSAASSNFVPSNGHEKEQMTIAPSDEFEKSSIHSENGGKFDLQKNTSSVTMKSENVIYEIAAIPGKGMGMIASRDIKRGELILQEDPVLHYECKESIEKNCHQLFKSYHYEFKKLNSRTQGDILSLSCNAMHQEQMKNSLISSLPPDIVQNEIFVKLATIYQSNSFVMEDIDKEKDEIYKGLYLLAARFNHSCLFNVQWYFKGNTIKFKAVEPISKGDELCISYVYRSISDVILLPDIEVTRSNLSSIMRFDCNCELCCTKDTEMRKEIENHRARYWKLFKKSHEKFFTRYPDTCGTTFMQDCIRLGADLISEMELGKIHNPCLQRCITAHCGPFARKCHDEKMFKYFLEKAREAGLWLEY